MAIQIFGTGKCFETKKAQRFFKERRINFQFIDLKEKGFSKGELEAVVNSLAKDFSGKEEVLDFIADPKNKDFASFKYLDDEDKFHKILDNPLLVKTPVVRNTTEKKATVGFCPEKWENWS